MENVWIDFSAGGGGGGGGGDGGIGGVGSLTPKPPKPPGNPRNSAVPLDLSPHNAERLVWKSDVGELIRICLGW